MQKNIDTETSTEDISEREWRPVGAPFGYYGSKQRLAKRIIELLPPHNAWVEAFCGSAAVTLAKKPAQIEIINDINGDVVNFFKVLRDNTKELCRVVSLTPYAREELKEARNKLSGLSELERARRFFVAAMMAINGCFGGDKGGFSLSNAYTRRGMEARVSRWEAMPEHLESVATRLSQVRIENKDAINLLHDFAKRPATLVYLDPPYLANRSNGYDHDEQSEEFHENLLKVAVRSKSMILLSGYSNDLYQDYLTPKRGWSKRVTAATTRGHNGKDCSREEVLWMNDRCRLAFDLKRIPIRLSKNERLEGKVNPLRS